MHYIDASGHAIWAYSHYCCSFIGSAKILADGAKAWQNLPDILFLFLQGCKSMTGPKTKEPIPLGSGL